MGDIRYYINIDDDNKIINIEVTKKIKYNRFDNKLNLFEGLFSFRTSNNNNYIIFKNINLEIDYISDQVMIKQMTEVMNNIIFLDCNILAKDINYCGFINNLNSYTNNKYYANNIFFHRCKLDANKIKSSAFCYQAKFAYFEYCILLTKNYYSKIKSSIYLHILDNSNNINSICKIIKCFNYNNYSRNLLGKNSTSRITGDNNSFEVEIDSVLNISNKNLNEEYYIFFEYINMIKFFKINNFIQFNNSISSNVNNILYLTHN